MVDIEMAALSDNKMKLGQWKGFPMLGFVFECVIKDHARLRRLFFVDVIVSWATKITSFKELLTWRISRVKRLSSKDTLV